MRNKLSLAAFILAACFIVSSIGKIQVNAESKNLNYIALGDSIAAYYGVEKSEGYVSLLANMLKSEEEYKSVTLNNFAHSGDDTKDLLKIINKRTAKPVIAKADIITISIGGNNFLKTLTGVFDGLGANTSAQAIPEGLSESELEKYFFEIINSLSERELAAISEVLKMPQVQAKISQGIADFAVDLPKIIETLQKTAPNARIYVMTVYNPLPETSPFFSIVEDLVNRENELIKAASGCSVVDVYSVFNSYESEKPLLSVGVHPNLNGHRVIANTHYEAVTGKKSADEVLLGADAVLTRGETISLLMDHLVEKHNGTLNLGSIPAQNVAPFADVAESNSRFSKIMSAKAIGIIGGDGSYLFNPDEIMIRADFAVVLDGVYKFIDEYGLEQAALNAEAAADYSKTDPLGGVKRADVENVF